MGGDNSKFRNACIDGELSVVQDMVREGYDINTVDSDGDTGLWGAIVFNHWDIVKLLLSQDTVNINWNKSGSDYTYLHYASHHGAPLSVISRLLNIMSTAGINTVSSGGNTALDIAVKRNHPDIVSCLGGREEVTWDMGRLEEVAR